MVLNVVMVVYSVNVVRLVKMYILNGIGFMFGVWWIIFKKFFINRKIKLNQVKVVMIILIKCGSRCCLV